MYILSLFPYGERGLFYFRKEYAYAEEITGETMAKITDSSLLTQGLSLREILQSLKNKERLL